MYLKLFLSFLLLTSTLFAEKLLSLENIQTEGDDFTLWAAVFGLGLISIFALFLSSEQIAAYKKRKEEEEEKEHIEHEKQDAIISKMGQSIHDIAKESNSSAKSETQLLAITTNLIDFLRIKSKKVTIAHQKLKLSNLLNDVSGTLHSNTKGEAFELIFDIDQNISQHINSDTLHMSKVLVNILLHLVESGSKLIELKIERTSYKTKGDTLSFTLQSNLKIDIEEKLNIFDANYNITTQEYDSLGLFIAKELSILMKGDLVARNDSNENLEFIFTIPYVEESYQEAKRENIPLKNILLIDPYDASANSIKYILHSLGHKVTRINQDEYSAHFPYFETYDVIFLDEKLFTKEMIEKLENTKIKIVATSNLFQTKIASYNIDIADVKLSKPSTVWQISDMMQQLCIENHDTSKIIKDGIINSGNMLVHKNSFQDTRNINLHDFIKFQNKKILLVEDNIINQKVFVGMLKRAHIDVSIANHGKEALKILHEKNDFDIIFMDINMPVMDGYTASIKIREQSECNDIPIIALSALTSTDEIAKMFTSGMNGYLPKPLKKEKLYTVFTLFIGNTHTVTKEQKIEDEKLESLELQGLNVPLGISKSSSNEVFYKEILLEFKDAYGKTDQLFYKLVNDFRYEQLRIVCVDINGLSGTIGAENLHKIVTEVLKKITLKKYDFIPELLKEYEVELKHVNSSIERYLS